MIRRITVENYMAHKLTVVELAQGVTVITGPNNTGKSAIVEAVRSIAQNPACRHAIRHGAKTAVVWIELDSGEVIEWNRSEKTAVYKISKNGRSETYAKFGRTPPDDVRCLLRLDLVETEAGSVDIHIGNQRQPIFLLDQAGSQAAGFFAASTEAAYLLKMQQLLKTRTDTAKSKRKKIIQERDDIIEELKRYELLDEIEVTLLRAEALYEDIQNRRRSLPLQEEVLRTLIAFELRHFLKVQCASVLESLASPPRLHETVPMELLSLETERIFRLVSRRREEREVLARLVSPPVMHEAHGLEELVSTMEKTQADHGVAKRKGLVLQTVPDSPHLHEVVSLGAILQDIRTALSKEETAVASLRTLRPLSSPPALSATAALDHLTKDLAQTQDLRMRLHSRMEISALLESPPSSYDVRDLEATVRFLESGMEDHQRTWIRSRTLNGIQPPPESAEVDSLNGLVVAIGECESKADLSEKKKDILRELESVPGLQETRSLESLIASLSGFRTRLEGIDTWMKVFSRIVPCPVPEPLHELDAAVKQMHALRLSLETTKHLHRECEQALLKKREEVEQTVKEIGICPLCGHSMDIDHFLERMHD